jgi:Domain of unknown function (DUF4136)
MKSPDRIAALTLLILLCVPATLPAGKVKAFPKKNVDLNVYKTYQWYPPRVLDKTGVVENHPANPVLMEFVGQQLARRGLTEVTSGADLKIQVWVLTESIPQVEAVIVNSMAALPGDYMSFGGPVATIGRYNRQGTLYFNLIDSKTNTSAWGAMVTDSLPTGTLSPDQIRSKLDKATSDIFKKYPETKK